MSWLTPSPAELGSIKSYWTNGYNGQKSYFINNSVLVYQCSSSIKFFDTHTNKTQSFLPECLNEDENTNGICLVKASATLKKFAYSDTKLSPTIYIHDFQDFNQVSKLTNGAEIEYLMIEFSNGEAILSLSNIPDMEIIIWNWMSGDKIGKIELNASSGIPECISFSPLNWRNLIAAYKNDFHVWNIERCDDKRFKTNKSRFFLPTLETDAIERIFPDFADDFVYSINAITKLEDEMGDIIEEILDKRERHIFQTLCWTNKIDELIIVTKKNFIFKYLFSSGSLKCIGQPETSNEDSPFKFDSSFEINSLKFHRKTMFAICSDGCLRLLDDKMKVRTLIKLPTTYLSNSDFNLQYTSIALSSSQGVYIVNSQKLLENNNQEVISYENSNTEIIKLTVNFDEGKTVGMSNINPAGMLFGVLKENGCLQIWNNKAKKIINRINLDKKCTSMSAHSKMPLLAVGTSCGCIIFVDVSNEHQLRVIEDCQVHDGSVQNLKFNSSGSLLFSVGSDGKLFIIDASLSSNVESRLVSVDQRLVTNNVKVDSFEKGFYVMGYVDYEGEAVCLDVLDTLDKQTTTTRVALGIHDSVAWDIIKKVIEDVLPFSQPNAYDAISIRSDKSEKDGGPSEEQPSEQSILISNVQDQSCINRLDYRNTDKNIEYCRESTQQTVKLACKVLVFDFNFNMFVKEKPQFLYKTVRLDLKEDLIEKKVSHSYYLFSDLVLTGHESVCLSTDKFITLFKLPKYSPVKKPTLSSKFTYLELKAIVGSHDFGYTHLSRSLNNQFVCSAGYDGLITIRKSGEMKSYVEIRASHYTNGGIEYSTFTSDGLGVIALCHDNSIMSFNWSCTFDQNVKLIQTPVISGDYDPTSLVSLTSYIESENSDNSTWFQIKEKKFFVEQDTQYLPIKKEIMAGLEEIRKNLRELMNENDVRDELAKLKESEFYLDLDELDRLHKETDNEIVNIREKTELENLAKMYIREQIKKECWDKMAVKGRGIQAFNSNLLVENYALKEKSKEEVSMLERVQMLRNIEINAQKTRNELSYDLMKKDNINEFVESNEDENKEGETTNQPNQSNNYLSPNLVPLAFKGSIGSLFSGDSNLFYSQFELFTIEQKWMQIILIQDAIFRIKSNFNNEFEQIMQRKNQEIAKIKEKNQRLKQIYIDLSQDNNIPEPKFGDAENPELLFEVKDDEIQVEKYLTPEQRKALEEYELELERKRQLEKMDNWRERGLFDMMGGVLQIRREDELKKDIPRPLFADKPVEEWTIDEQKQYAAYEQRCKELNDEREKLRKQLNAEIIKLNEQILECYQNFDNQLLTLHLRKVKTQQAVYQEELKIVRLFNNIIIDTELEINEAQLTAKLEKIKEEKRELTIELQKIKKFVDEYKESYEIASAEDKAQDKAFMREFSDIYPVSTREQMLKLYKKRPKQRMVANITVTNGPNVFVPEYGADNPFSDRPSTAQQIMLYDNDTDVFLADLDQLDNSPGVDQHIWERFVAYRREKIKMENNLKKQGLTLSEMNIYLQKRIEDDENKKLEIENLTNEIVSFQEERLKASHNLQVQLLMKQGQVEINPGVYIHNFKNCTLVHRDAVESLNKIIQHHGSQKINIMVECKDYKKGIRQLEWEHRRMKMTIEDFIQKQRDITYLKLTREIQTFLDNPDYDAMKQREISILEATIAYKNKQNEKIYSQKAKAVKDINKSSVKVANVNDQFDDKLRENNVVLHDRKHIHEEISGKDIESIREEKFQQIIQRRKLVDLAKAQAQEVAFLRSEVERLRMKTFPALVQIEF